MEVLFPRCAGLDVHNKSVVACVRVVEQSKVHCHLRSFDTTTASLLSLSAFLSRARASSWSARLPSTRSGFRRRWRTPTSSWTTSSPISWA